MKNVMIAVLMMASSSAFAGQKDLKIFKQLLKVGATAEGAMSHVYVSVENISCQTGLQSGESDCRVHDVNFEGGKGRDLDLNGRKADIILNIIESANAPSDSGMGHMWTEAASISCVQVAAGVVDGNPSAADRTTCTIDIGQEPSAN